MPKEHIYDQDYRREAVIMVDGAGETAGTPQKEIMSDAFGVISWSKDGEYVQLSVRSDKDPDGFESLHLTLDRAGLNRLIRFARRARDDAFGKDE